MRSGGVSGFCLNDVICTTVRIAIKDLTDTREIYAAASRICVTRLRLQL
jgi:hypothetical protein